MLICPGSAPEHRAALLSMLNELPVPSLASFFGNYDLDLGMPNIAADLMAALGGLAEDPAAAEVVMPSFDEVDTNNDGVIDRSEFAGA